MTTPTTGITTVAFNRKCINVSNKTLPKGYFAIVSLTINVSIKPKGMFVMFPKIQTT